MLCNKNKKILPKLLTIASMSYRIKKRKVLIIVCNYQYDLIEQVKQGDEHAFEQLYRDFYKLAFYFALHLCQNEADAKDAVQDTFIEIHRSIATLKENSYFKAWMYKIVHSKCKKIFRKNKHVTTDFEDEPLMSTIKEERMEFTPEQFTRFHSDKEVLQSCIDQLPQSQRDIIMLYYLEQMSIKEISDILDIPVGTVKSRLSYGRTYLKRVLEEYQDKQGEPITFHTLDVAITTCLMSDFLRRNITVPPFRMKKTWTIRKDKWAVMMAATGCLVVFGGFYAYGQIRQASQSVNEEKTEDVVKNPFQAVMIDNESIHTAQDAYFTLIAWACCDEMLKEKPMDEILWAEPLYEELKKHGGKYYEQLVVKRWNLAYEERLAEK